MWCKQEVEQHTETHVTWPLTSTPHVVWTGSRAAHGDWIRIDSYFNNDSFICWWKRPVLSFCFNVYKYLVVMFPCCLVDLDQTTETSRLCVNELIVSFSSDLTFLHESCKTFHGELVNFEKMVSDVTSCQIFHCEIKEFESRVSSSEDLTSRLSVNLNWDEVFESRWKHRVLMIRLFWSPRWYEPRLQRRIHEDVVVN